MGGLLILIGLGGFLFGLMNQIRPFGRLRFASRGQAGLVLGASLALIIIGAAISPTRDLDSPQSSPTASVSTSATVVSSTLTSTAVATSAASVQSTSTTSRAPSSTSTSTGNSTSTTPPSGVLALDVLMTIPVKLETPSGYERELFPHWSDVDGDGCDTRDEVLVRDAAGTAKVGSGCFVTTGLWYSSYDGVWLDNASQIEIDHVVALKEAWDSGANQWDTARREAFANDLDDPHTLIAVSSSSNQEKGEADPSNWLPDHPDDKCRFIVAWVTVKARWELSMDESEHGRIRNLLEGVCQGSTLAEGVVVRPPNPSPTTTSPPNAIVPGSSDVTITNIVYDGPGNDVVFNDSEYVLLHNGGPGTADVGGWWLIDLADHQIVFPSGVSIAPRGELRVYTGPGASTPTAYFAGLGQAIWNNSGGDTATLIDSAGQKVASYSYSS